MWQGARLLRLGCGAGCCAGCCSVDADGVRQMAARIGSRGAKVCSLVGGSPRLRRALVRLLGAAGAQAAAEAKGARAPGLWAWARSFRGPDGELTVLFLDALQGEGPCDFRRLDPDLAALLMLLSDVLVFLSPSDVSANDLAQLDVLLSAGKRLFDIGAHGAHEKENRSSGHRPAFLWLRRSKRLTAGVDDFQEMAKALSTMAYKSLQRVFQGNLHYVTLPEFDVGPSSQHSGALPLKLDTVLQEQYLALEERLRFMLRSEAGRPKRTGADLCTILRAFTLGQDSDTGAQLQLMASPRHHGAQLEIAFEAGLQVYNKGMESAALQEGTDLNECHNKCWRAACESLQLAMQQGVGEVDAGAVLSRLEQSIMVWEKQIVSRGSFVVEENVLVSGRLLYFATVFQQKLGGNKTHFASPKQLAEGRKESAKFECKRNLEAHVKPKISRDSNLSTSAPLIRLHTIKAPNCDPCLKNECEVHAEEQLARLQSNLEDRLRSLGRALARAEAELTHTINLKLEQERTIWSESNQRIREALIGIKENNRLSFATLAENQELASLDRQNLRNELIQELDTIQTWIKTSQLSLSNK